MSSVVFSIASAVGTTCRIFFSIFVLQKIKCTLTTMRRKTTKWTESMKIDCSEVRNEKKIHLKMPTSLKCRRDEPAFLETQFRMRNYSFTLTPCWSFTHINNVHFFIPQLFPRLCCFVSLCMQLQFELSVYSEFWFRAALGVLYIVTRWKLLVLSSNFSLSFHNFFLICNVEILRDDIVVERDEMPSYAS